MTRFLTFLAGIMISQCAYAQLPDGSIAPDFTATDINGTTHNLQSYLDEGKLVVLHFSATWCGPCWSFHEDGPLNDLYQALGPEGTDDLMVFFIESDPSTTDADLHGTGPNTVGDWVTGTPYPIIDNAAIFDDYQNTYFPTVYTVCSNGLLTEQSFWNGESANQYIQEVLFNCGSAISGAAAMIEYAGDGIACGSDPWASSVNLTNLGNEVISSAGFEVVFTAESAPVNSYVEWSGNVDAGETSLIDLQLPYDSPGELEIELVEINGEARSNELFVAVAPSVPGANTIEVSITPDCWPEEISWQIRDEEGSVVVSASMGNEPEGIPVTWVEVMPDDGCYTFLLLDSYGDGLNGCQWIGDGCNTCGSATVRSVVGDIPVSTIFELTGEANNSELAYSERIAGFEVSSTLIVEGCTDTLAFNFDASALIDDGSCVYFATNCEFLGNDSWDVLTPGLYLEQSQVEHELGAYVNGEFVLHLPPFYADDNGALYEVSSWDNLVWSGLPEGLSLTNAQSQIAGNTQVCVTYNGTPFEEGTFEVTVTGDLMVSVFGNPFSVGEISSSFTMVITPNANGILGCTYAHAVNFNPVASIDDGSCMFGGCTDPDAPNFEPHASVDNGTCETEPCVASCLGDLNNDGSIGSADLLTLLTTFGGDCE